MSKATSARITGGGGAQFAPAPSSPPPAPGARRAPQPPWTARVWAEFHARNLTRGERDVLLTLRTYRGPGGGCWPAHATLADRARCSVRTVIRALAAARTLGLVDWTERRVRRGWRWLRTTNWYRFLTPAGRVVPAPRPGRIRTKCHGGTGGESQSKTEALGALLAAAGALPDLLARRRDQFTQRLKLGLTTVCAPAQR